MAFSDSLSCVRRSLHKSFSVPGQQSGTVCGVDLPNVWYPPQSNKWDHMSPFESFEKMLGSFSASGSLQNQETTNTSKTETTSHSPQPIGAASLSFSERKYFEDDAEKDYNSLSSRPKGGISSYAWLNALSEIGKADSMTSKAELDNGSLRPDSVADLATFLSSTPANLERRTSLRNQSSVEEKCISLSNSSQTCETEMLPDVVHTAESTSPSGDQLPGMSFMATTLPPMTAQPRSSCAVIQATVDKFTPYRTIESDAHVPIPNEQDEDGAAKLFDPRRPISEEELKPQPIIRKARKVHVPDEFKDNKYWKRRLKNNVAARRSREARRMKENQIAMRASFLERENDALRMEVKRLRKELKSMAGSTTGLIAGQHAHPSFVSTM